MPKGLKVKEIGVPSPNAAVLIFSKILSTVRINSIVKRGFKLPWH